MASLPTKLTTFLTSLLGHVGLEHLISTVPSSWYVGAPHTGHVFPIW